MLTRLSPRRAEVVILFGVLLPTILLAGVDTAWVRRYDGPAHGADWAVAVAVDSLGNVYVAGSSAGTDSSIDCVTIAYAANGETLWVRRYGGEGNCRAAAMAMAARRDVYVTGQAGGDFLTLKYDSAGVLLWARSFGGPEVDGAQAIAADPSGNAYVTGYVGNGSGNDFVTISYRPDGDTAWTRTYVGPAVGWDYPMAIAVDASSAVVIAGYGAGDGTHNDCETVKYDSSGTQLWVARYDGPQHGDDRAQDVAVDDSGDVTIAGFGDDGYGTPPSYLTVKYSHAGETLWTRRYDGPAHDWDEASAVAVDSTGNIYVTGYAYVTGGVHPNVATVKYAPTGQQLWVALFGGPIDNYGKGNATALDGAGGVYVCGVSAFTPGAYGDYATIKYDATTGDTAWVTGYNGTGSDVDLAQAIAVDSKGCVYVTGESYGGIGTGNDIATVKYVQNGGVAEESHAPAASRLSLVAKPSVFSSWAALQHSLENTAATRSQVFDAMGRRATQAKPGVYFVVEEPQASSHKLQAVRKVVLVE